MADTGSNPISGEFLAPFARRIRLLRAWRIGAIGGTIGGGLALVVALFDLLNWVNAEWWVFIVLPLTGAVVGMVRAILEPLPLAIVARSVDRRGGFDDRLTTTVAYSPENNSSASPIARALREDAVSHIGGVRARRLYPLRWGRWNTAFVVLSLVANTLFFAGINLIFHSAGQKRDAAEMRAAAKEVERIAKPLLQEAKRPDAEADAKALAHRLEQFARDLKRARMSKPEALVKANELAEAAQRLQAKRADALAKSVQGAQTAGQKLAKMGQNARIEKGDVRKNAEATAAAESKIAQLQKQLANGKDANGKPLSEKAKSELEKQLQKAKENLAQLKLSKEAMDAFQKLQSLPEFKEAQALLAKLAQNAQSQSSGKSGQMTPEQMEAAAKRLEELAKQLDTDEKRKEFAKKLLEAAKNARLGKGDGVGVGLMGAMGTGGTPGPGMGNGPRVKGPSGPGDVHSQWGGPGDTLARSDKSELLKPKFQDAVTTSEVGTKGAETYMEVTGPASLGARSSVPYEKMLPRYEKSAESALSKGNIPSNLRGKVRNYFDALRK